MSSRHDRGIDAAAVAHDEGHRCSGSHVASRVCMSAHPETTVSTGEGDDATPTPYCDTTSVDCLCNANFTGSTLMMANRAETACPGGTYKEDVRAGRSTTQCTHRRRHSGEVGGAGERDVHYGVEARGRWLCGPFFRGGGDSQFCMEAYVQTGRTPENFMELRGRLGANLFRPPAQGILSSLIV